MKTFLVEVTYNEGTQAAAEFLDREYAIRVADKTFSSGAVDVSLVRDPVGDIVWARGVSSRVGGAFK